MPYQDELTKARQALVKGLDHLGKKEYAEASAAYKDAALTYDEVIKCAEAQSAGTLHKHIQDNMHTAYYNLVASLNGEKKFQEALDKITEATNKGIILVKVDELKGHIYHNLGASLYKDAKDALDGANPQIAFNTAKTILDKVEITDAKTKVQACSIMWQARQADTTLDVTPYLDKMKSAIDATPQGDQAALATIVKYISSHVAVSYLAVHNTAAVKTMLDPKYGLTIDDLRTHVLDLNPEKTKVEALIDLASKCGDAATSGPILVGICSDHGHSDLYQKALLGNVNADEVLA